MLTPAQKPRGLASKTFMRGITEVEVVPLARFAREHGLQLAFYTLVPFYVLAVLCFLWLARAFRADARDGVTA